MVVGVVVGVVNLVVISIGVVVAGVVTFNWASYLLEFEILVTMRVLSSR